MAKSNMKKKLEHVSWKVLKIFNPRMFKWLSWSVCVYSNSRNDVLRVAQRYGTIAAHTRRRASVLVVFVVFLRAYVQFCRFDKADATADVQ